MFHSYLNIALRNLKINRFHSISNIIGLSVGLAAGILVLLCVLEEFSFDQFHTKLRNTYLLMQHQKQGVEIHTNSAMPAPLAAKLRAEMPEVNYAARVLSGQQLLNHEGKNFSETGIYTDPDLFNIMTFPAISGNPMMALQEPNSVVITERTANKLFPHTTAVGQTLRHNNLHDLKVGAVIQNLPENSTIKADVILPFSLYEQGNPGAADQWDNNFLNTWITLQPGASVAVFNKKIEKFLAEKTQEATVLFAYPFKDLHLYSRFKDGKQVGGLIEMMVMLSVIGIFVLLIACINFMNLATARTERRAREVGVRKVMGAQRLAIISQFLSEALMMTFFALALSILLVQFALPLFNQVLNKQLSLNFSHWQLWASLLSLGLLTGLVAGSYPAFFLSAFQPVRVLKGVVSSGRGSSILRKGLVGFQFFVSFFLVVCVVVIFKQMEHVQNRPLGYDLENLIVIPANGDMAEKFDVLKNSLIQIPGIKHVSAGSDNLLRFGASVNGISWPGKTAEDDFSLTLTHVQYDWTQTVGLKMVEGRDFSPEFGGDTIACVLNQAAVKRMKLKEPIGQLINSSNPIIGVVEDFVYNDPSESPAPMIMYLSTKNMSNFLVRIQNDRNWQKSLKQLEKVVKKLNPNIPYSFSFAVDEHQKKFEGMRKSSRMISLFGILAICIAALGLSGLSAFVVERRRKEMGIRKVMGATTGSVWLALSQEFLTPVFGGVLLSVPLSFWAMNLLLQNFEYKIGLSWEIFVFTGLGTIIVALLTVSNQAIRAALVNPVKSLKSE